MRSRRLAVLAVVAATAAAGSYAAAPYARAGSLVVRAAKIGGRVEAFARDRTYAVRQEPRHLVPTRHGDVAAQFYVPEAGVRRTVLLVPGIHSLGIEEPRLTALAADLAGSGVRVMAMALPDLQHYRITPDATDVIEDALAWMAARPDLAPDGRIGVIGISFAGGLAISAVGRPSIRHKVAYVVSFGGHGDIRRVMRYIATGEAPKVEGVRVHPPHDYAVAVVLYGLADKGVVPGQQVNQLRSGIETFLLASQLTLVDMNQADATFAKAREMQKSMPEPSATLMSYVNDRDVAKLGPRLVPHLKQLGDDNPALSPALAAPPEAPVFLLHGDGDTVIPTAESSLLANDLERHGADVHLLLSSVITHAEANRAAAATEVWRLIRFWADVLGR
jgi:dienelactone hydrolase